jgi:hypothetical protein
MGCGAGAALRASPDRRLRAHAHPPRAPNSPQACLAPFRPAYAPPPAAAPSAPRAPAAAPSQAELAMFMRGAPELSAHEKQFLQQRLQEQQKQEHMPEAERQEANEGGEEEEELQQQHIPQQQQQMQEQRDYGGPFAAMSLGNETAAGAPASAFGAFAGHGRGGDFASMPPPPPRAALAGHAPPGALAAPPPAGEGMAAPWGVADARALSHALAQSPEVLAALMRSCPVAFAGCDAVPDAPPDAATGGGAPSAVTFRPLPYGAVEMGHAARAAHGAAEYGVHDAADEGGGCDSIRDGGGDCNNNDGAYGGADCA